MIPNYFNDRELMDLLRPAEPKRVLRTDSVVTDSAMMDAAGHAMQSIASQAASAVQVWTEEDLAGEGAADRLLAMLVGIADDNKDGELSEDERQVVDVAANQAWDYMSALGVSDDDLEAIFNAEDPEVSNSAGDRVREFLISSLPDGEDGADAQIDSFAFDADSSTATMDAVYKKRMVVRNGAKRIVMKRVSGHVKLSAAQKVAVRKMQRKSHGSRAMARRMKSMRIRTRLGLK